VTKLMVIKRGDTFSFTATMTDSTGVPIENQVENFKSEIRDVNNVLITELLVEETAILGTYSFTATTTEDWIPLTDVYMDIQYTLDGNVNSSETMSISVLQDITQ